MKGLTFINLLFTRTVLLISCHFLNNFPIARANPIEIANFTLNSQCNTPYTWLSEYPEIHSGLLWPNARVPYKISSFVSITEAYRIFRAINEYHEKTCIRFEPRLPLENSFVRIERERENKLCAYSQFCFKNKPQFIKISSKCFKKSVLVHQLGHTLCLPHEHQRPDRDDFLDFRHCSDDKIPPKNSFDTKGHLFDYASQMHAVCDMNNCVGGRPKLEGAENCGVEVAQKGMTWLSVLDADKINEMYNCQGCYRHRWRNVKNLTENDTLSMVPFGYGINDIFPAYLCRAYIKGEISPGQYNRNTKVCYIVFEKEIHKVRDKVQVFTLPQVQNTVEANKHSTYRTLSISSKFSKDTAIPVGRSSRGVPIYAAMKTMFFNKFTGRLLERVIGKVYGNEDQVAMVRFQYEAKEVYEFDVLVCTTSGNTS